MQIRLLLPTVEFNKISRMITRLRVQEYLSLRVSSDSNEEEHQVQGNRSPREFTHLWCYNYNWLLSKDISLRKTMHTRMHQRSLHGHFCVLLGRYSSWELCVYVCEARYHNRGRSARARSVVKLSGKAQNSPVPSKNYKTATPTPHQFTHPAAWALFNFNPIHHPILLAHERAVAVYLSSSPWNISRESNY